MITVIILAVAITCQAPVVILSPAHGHWLIQECGRVILIGTADLPIGFVRVTSVLQRPDSIFKGGFE